MTTTITALPTLLSINRSSTLVVPARLFTTELSLTLNACTAPDAYNQSDPSIFTASTNDSLTYSSTLYGGFGNITVPATEDEQQLTVVLRQPGADDSFTFELGISDSEPWHILDRLPLFAYEDSDNTTALLSSPTYPSALVEQPSYQPLVTNTELVRADLSNSTCYLRSLSSLSPPGSIATSLTRRGVVELGIAEGGAINETLRGGMKLQYAVSGLQTGSNYSTWGLQQRPAVSTSNATATRLYQRQYFSTKSVSNCRLLFNVPFCPNVAYSVPAPFSMPSAELLDLYNSTIQPALQGFNTTLYTFPCESLVKDSQGQYSFIRTCSQCLEAYTSWLCAVRMPRCVDYVENAPATNDGHDTAYTFQRTSAADSRTPDLPGSAFPYSEIPPCLGVCNLVQASCPPVISNLFTCPVPHPSTNYNASYALPFSKQITFTNVQGGDDADWLGNDLDRDDAVDRAQDRFGNVRCNDMGTSQVISRRRYAGASSLSTSSASRSRLSTLDFRISIAIIATFALALALL